MNGLGFGITISLNDLFSGALDNAVGNFRNLEGVSQSVANSVEKSFERMKLGAGIAGVGVAMAAPFIYATDKAMEFEAQMSSIKAVAPDTNITELSALALQAGKETAFSATEAGKGIEELVKAGVQMEQIMGGGLTAALNLATAGEIGVADAAEIASTALNAFRNDNLSVSDAANVLAGAANASATSVRELKFGLSAVSAVASGMGFNFAEVNTALAVLAQNGLKGSDAGTSLKTMLQNLQPDTKEQIKLFKELGIITANNQNQFLTAEGGFKSLAEISKVLQTQLSGLTVAERAKSLEKMFGTDAVRAANIFFKESEQGFASMQTAMNKVTVEQVAAERLNNLKGSFEQLSGSFETLLINVGMVLTPILKGITDVGIVVVNVFNEIIESPVGGVIVAVGAAIAVATTALGLGIVAFNAYNAATAMAIPLMTSFATTLGITATSLGAIALPLVATIAVVSSAILLLKKSYDSFITVLNGGAKAEGFLGFMQKIGGAIHGVIEVFNTATKNGFTISEDLQKSLQKVGILNFVIAMGTWAVRIKEFFNGFISGFDRLGSQFAPLMKSFTILGDTIGNLLSRFGIEFEKNTSSVTMWSLAGKAAFELVMLPITGLVFALTNLANVFTFVIEVGQSFYDNFVGFFSDLGFYFDSFMNGTMSFGQVIGAIFDNIGNRVTAMLDRLTNAWTQFKITLIESVQALPFGDTILGMVGVNTAENTAGGTQTPEQTRGALFQDTAVNNNFAAAKNEKTMLQTYQQTSIEKNTRVETAPTAPIITLQPKFDITLDGEQINNNVRERQENESARK